jgi:hypothetical protein
MWSECPGGASWMLDLPPLCVDRSFGLARPARQRLRDLILELLDRGLAG